MGNDVEDDQTPNLPVREVVKKGTSSKKADVPPPSADPARSKKKGKPTGNEGAIKTKLDNKDVPSPPNTNSKHYKKPFDRHSRSNKTDSKKKIKQGWGNADTKADAEIEGANDAAEELEEENQENAESGAEKKSLQDYFAELQVKQQVLDGSKKTRQANEGQEKKWSTSEQLVKEQEPYFESTASKKAKAKAPKEKKFLDVEAVFADEKPFEPRRGSSTRGGARGAKRGNFGAKRGTKTSSKSKPVINDQNFPSL